MWPRNGLGRRLDRRSGSLGELDWHLLALGLHGRGPSWPLGCHIMAYWLDGLGLGPLSCPARSSCRIMGLGSGMLCNKVCYCIGLGLMSRACYGSCQVLGLLPIGLEVDLGLLLRVWWEWCHSLVALPWPLGHGSDGGGAAPAIALSLEDLRREAMSLSPLFGLNPSTYGFHSS
ncbi:hypothetical protein TB2_009388 [Malus domestica]